LVSRIGASPLWRAGLASAFILGLAGFAAGVIPQACRNGVVVCQANAPGSAEALAPVEAPEAAEPSIESVATAEPAAAPAPAAMDTAMLAQQPASLTRNDLIAQTFAALDVPLTTVTGELTARKVRTVTIGPDGMPVLDAPAPAAAEPAPVAVAEAEIVEPEPEPAPVVVEEPSVAPSAEEEPTASAYAPVRGGTAIVGRQGANVRSLPQTRGSEVLYALASGEEVTVVETQKGWSKVVDSNGRSGWVWGELLRR
jgi:hypothetical protein